MGFLELLLIGVGLSMDAFAVAVCQGLCMPKLNLRYAAVIALFFGGFQALMPLIGYFLGNQFESSIVSVDHWIAFTLLVFIGGKMIIEVFKEDKAPKCDVFETKLDIREVFILAVATSIDALAVGLTFACRRVDIEVSVVIIGITTFVLSAAGVAIGKKFGVRFKNKATVAGGIILILIGTKILLQHLGIL